MTDFLLVLFYLLVLAGIGGGIYVALPFIKGYLSGSASGGFFGPRVEKRLDIVEQSTLDGRRRLVLIRRDDVEHLIMTGGPVDVVIETGIAAKRSRAGGEIVDGPGATFSRPPRTIGQTADK